MFEDNHESLDGVYGKDGKEPNALQVPNHGSSNISEFAAHSQEGAPHIDSCEYAGTDWISFLFLLGNHIEQLRQNGRRPCVVLVVPTVEFASLLIATGIIFRTVMRIPEGASSGGAQKFGALINRAVRFPRMVKGKKRQLRGILEELKVVNGVERLVIRYFDGKGERRLKCWAHVSKEDFSLVAPDEETIDLSTRQHGRQLAVDISSLQRLVGHHGASSLLSQCANTCWIIDAKSRVTKELEVPVPINRLRKPDEEKEESPLLLRDVVRPDFPQWPAVAESSHSHVDVCPPSSGNWASTIVVGTLPFLRFFESLESEIRICIISPTMSMYDEAISQAQNFFEQRAEHEIVIPDDLLFAKPASFDIQIWETL